MADYSTIMGIFQCEEGKYGNILLKFERNQNIGMGACGKSFINPKSVFNTSVGFSRNTMCFGIYPSLLKRIQAQKLRISL